MTINVGITQRVDAYDSRNEVRDALDQAFISWVCQAGHIPIPVPNVLSKDALQSWLSAVRIHALILSGGNDIGQCASRDETELSLLQWSIQHHIPVLGICRGMQFMAHFEGAPLVSVANHVATEHAVKGEINARVNSFHTAALQALPEGWTCLATAEDGVIEAMQHNTRKWEAWMWHPERSAPFDTMFLQRFNNLVSR